MANSLDQLQIDIVAQDKASDTIEALSRSIQSLGEALEKLNTRKLKNMAETLKGLNININMNGVSSAIENIGDSAKRGKKYSESMSNVQRLHVTSFLRGQNTSKQLTASMLVCPFANSMSTSPTWYGKAMNCPETLLHGTIILSMESSHPTLLRASSRRVQMISKRMPCFVALTAATNKHSEFLHKTILL
jgi:hypothetical protein